MKKHAIFALILGFLVVASYPVSAGWDTFRVYLSSIFGGGGTTNTVPKFTGATSLGDSTITDAGAVVKITVAGDATTDPLLYLINSRTPATGVSTETETLHFQLYADTNGATAAGVAAHNAVILEAYKISDWYQNSGEADIDSGLKIYVADGGADTLALTINNSLLATFAGAVTATGTLTGNGIVTLGDGGDAFSIASTGIDIDSSGNISNAGTISGTKVSVAATQVLGSPGTVTVAASNAKNTSKWDYVCTGTNDELTFATALAALPAAGGTLQLSEGTFSVGANTVVPSNVWIRGMGTNATSIVAAAGSISVFKPSASPAWTYNVKISDLEIDCNSKTDIMGVEAVLCERLTIDNVYCHDGSTGNTYLFMINTCIDTRITGCVLDTSGDSVIEMKEINTFVFANNICRDGSFQIYAQNSSSVGTRDISVVNNTFDNCHITHTVNASVIYDIAYIGNVWTSDRSSNDNSWNMRACDGLVISGNTIDTDQATSISHPVIYLYDGVDNALVTGNYIRTGTGNAGANGYGAILCEADVVTIAENEFWIDKVNNYGVKTLTDATDIIIRDNRFFSDAAAGTVGVDLTNCTVAELHGNTFNTFLTGIDIDSTSARVIVGDNTFDTVTTSYVNTSTSTTYLSHRKMEIDGNNTTTTFTTWTNTNRGGTCETSDTISFDGYFMASNDSGSTWTAKPAGRIGFYKASDYWGADYNDADGGIALIPALDGSLSSAYVQITHNTDLKVASGNWVVESSGYATFYNLRSYNAPLVNLSASGTAYGSTGLSLEGGNADTDEILLYYGNGYTDGTAGNDGGRYDTTRFLATVVDGATPGGTVDNFQPSGSVTRVYHVTHDDITASGATTADLVITTLPAKSILQWPALIVVTEQGVHTDTLTLSLGSAAANYDQIVVDSDGKGAANATYGDAQDGSETGTDMDNAGAWYPGKLYSISATQAITLHADGNAANLSAANFTAGEYDVYLTYTVLP